MAASIRVALSAGRRAGPASWPAGSSRRTRRKRPGTACGEPTQATAVLTRRCAGAHDREVHSLRLRSMPRDIDEHDSCAVAPGAKPLTFELAGEARAIRPRLGRVAHPADGPVPAACTGTQAGPLASARYRSLPLNGDDKRTGFRRPHPDGRSLAASMRARGFRRYWRPEWPAPWEYLDLANLRRPRCILGEEPTVAEEAVADSVSGSLVPKHQLSAT